MCRKSTLYECVIAGRHEQLAPSLAPNPTLRSFLDVLTELQADSNAAVSAEDFPKELNFVQASEAALKADQDVQSLFPDLKVGTLPGQYTTNARIIVGFWQGQVHGDKSSSEASCLAVISALCCLTACSKHKIDLRIVALQTRKIKAKE